jgi:hypothetical protein
LVGGSRLGLQACLVAFPLATLALIVWVWLSPSMWILFAGQVAIKVQENKNNSNFQPVSP